MLNSETRTCQNCKNQFVIEPEDFAFYEKMQVPPPTFCPECRLQRRLAFLNHSTLYKRQCNLCGNNIIAIYDANVPFPVYCPPCYNSDKWDPKSYGRDYDFSVPFFEQLRRLDREVPHMSLMTLYSSLVNSEYNNYAGRLKNCYLLFNSDYDENCMYGSEVERSKDCVDNTMIESCELCYEGVNLTNCYSTHFSRDCENCRDVWFSKNCIDCSNCFGCMDLKNKKYHIFNLPYSKEDYEKEIQRFELNTRKGLEEALKKTEEFFLRFPNKFYHGKQNIGSSGDYLNHCKYVRDSYIALESEQCRYCMWLIIKNNKDCYDFTQFGENTERVYESLVCGAGVRDVKFSNSCVDNVSYLYYSEFCYSASHMFGCMYMQRGNSYCILNKQYSKEEYEAMLPKIIKHMDDTPYTDKHGKVYHYGEFPPTELSRFAYNETLAQEFFPLTKTVAMAQGYVWKKPEGKNYTITISADALPGASKDIPENAVNEVIECGHRGMCEHQCATAFRIIPMELSFYRRINLPLPQLCPKCRGGERLHKRNPIQLWRSKCQCAGEKSENGVYRNTGTHQSHAAGEHCPNRFQTSYAPNRPEIVYCEQCYQAEVA